MFGIKYEWKWKCSGILIERNKLVIDIVVMEIFSFIHSSMHEDEKRWKSIEKLILFVLKTRECICFLQATKWENDWFLYI